MRFHPGVDPDKATFGYLQALQGFSIEAIAHGIRKFLRGECEGVNPRFCPHPPELAQIVRTVTIPSRIPRERQIEPAPRQSIPGERERMLLKMPMYRHAMDVGKIEELAEANRKGFGAMVVLATRWGIPVPQALLEQSEHETEEQWRRARILAWREIDANPPPFLRRSA